jgi:glycine betaine/choline ABC-type transport system substrate-binding protein
LRIVAIFEQQQIDCGRVFGTDAEIDAVGLAGGSEGKAFSFPDTNIRQLVHRLTAAKESAALRAE